MIMQFSLKFSLALAAALFATHAAFAQAPAIPTFVDETASSGITTSYDGDWSSVVFGRTNARNEALSRQVRSI